MGFRLFGVDVEIHFSFWITTILLGLLGDSPDIGRTLIWAAVVFVSILVHEYGHAFAVKRHRIEPSIRLHGMGGTTHYRPLLRMTRWQEIFISLAGPFAGFALGGLVLFVDLFFVHSQRIFVGRPFPFFFWPVRPGTLGMVVSDLLWVNFSWGLFNLLPVLPLDGGHVLESAFGPKRVVWALRISLGAAILGAGACMLGKLYWGAFILAMCGFQTFRRLQSDSDVSEIAAPRPAAPREPPVPPEIAAKLRSARHAIADDDLTLAATLANEAVRLAGEHDTPLPAVKVEAYELLGWAAFHRGDAAEASRWIKAAQQHGPPDAALVAAVLAARGDTKDARRVLEQARAAGDDRKEIVGPLIQVLIAEGEVPRAAAVALDIAESLSDEDARKMAEIAFGASAFDWAARLYEAVFARSSRADDAYEAARAFAADGAHDRALDFLARAVSAGFSDRARAWSDAALEPLRAGRKLETVLPRP